MGFSPQFIAHEDPEIDLVLRENDRFATVEKFFGAGAKIARATDPRGSSRSC